MLHSASPNRYGAGVRCLYDSRGQLVEGRQERYWRSSRQMSPFRGKHSRSRPPCAANQGVGGLETSPCQAARHQLEPVNHFNPRASLSSFWGCTGLRCGERPAPLFSSFDFFNPCPQTRS